MTVTAAPSPLDYADQVGADLRQPGPGDTADTERDLTGRALAAYRRESMTADIRAVLAGCTTVIIVAASCTPKQAPDGRGYCMCEALAAYRTRSDGRLRRTGTRAYTMAARDCHKTPEQLRAESERAKAMLQLLRMS